MDQKSQKCRRKYLHKGDTMIEVVKKFEDFFLGNTGEISFAKSRGETIEDELTGLEGIFFWSWPGDTADGNRLPVILS